MERTKKLFIGMSIFLFVMFIGMSFSYGEGINLVSGFQKDQIVKPTATDWDYVFTGTGGMVETTSYHDGSDYSVASGTLTSATISLSALADNVYVAYFEYVRSDGSTGGFQFYPIARGNQLYFNTNLSSASASSIWFGTLTYLVNSHNEGRMEMTLTFNRDIPSSGVPVVSVGTVYSATCLLQ